MYATCALPLNGTRWCSHIENSGMSRTMIISSKSAPSTTVTNAEASAPTPAKISRYMRPTRAGVSRKPPRSGSSPIPSRINRTPCSIFAWSKGSLMQRMLPGERVTRVSGCRCQPADRAPPWCPRQRSPSPATPSAARPRSSPPSPCTSRWAGAGCTRPRHRWSCRTSSRRLRSLAPCPSTAPAGTACLGVRQDTWGLPSPCRERPRWASRRRNRTRTRPGSERSRRRDAWCYDARRAGCGSGSTAVRGRLQRADVRKVPISLREVEAVADDELVGDVEPDVSNIELDLLDAFFAQERSDLERRGLAPREVLQQVLQCEAGVHDVFDDEHIAVLQVVIEVLEDAHDTRGLGGRAVGRHRHEVELERQ